MQNCEQVMVRRSIFILCISLALGLGMAGQAQHVRVLLPPAPARVADGDLREGDVRTRLVLQLYLEEWFSQASDVMLADAAQAGALLGQAVGPAWVRPEGGVFAAVNDILEVDAVVTLKIAAGTVTCVAHRADDAAKLTVPFAGTVGLPALLEAITAFLGAELEVGRATSPLDRDLPKDNPQLIEDAYVSRRLWAAWTSNSGEARLKLLHSYLNRLPQDTFAAAAIMDAAAWMTRDGRDVTAPDKWALVAQQALLSLLGTEREAEALSFCRVNKYKVDALEKDLIASIAKVGVDDMDLLLSDDAAPAQELPDLDTSSQLEGLAGLLAAQKTVPQLAGAIRCLGAMKSVNALPHMIRIARGAKDAELRNAVALALAEYDGTAGLDGLTLLLDDAEQAVEFAAAHSLWQRGQAVPNLLALARAELEMRPENNSALTVIADEGEAGDARVLKNYAADASPQRRLRAVRGLLRLKQASPQEIEGWLADPSTAVVQTALAGLSVERLEQHRDTLVRLGNHPHGELAEAARLALSQLLPEDALERARFEVTFEHPYVRRQIVEAWAKAGGSAGIAGLESAAANPDPHTRALAILHLAEADVQKARAKLPKLLTDPHRMVRLFAAAAAVQVVTPDDAPVLQSALAAQVDEATRSYLRDALARAEGDPLPPPGRAVNVVSAERNMSFSCGWTAEVDKSAFDGFYGLNLPPEEQVEPMRRAHADGKVFLLRANQTAKNPAQVFLNSYWRDGFWLGLDAEFAGLWDCIDGVVLGEESMYFRPWNEWAGGWRLFCREAGIDPRRVGGDREKLTEHEKKAWWDWEQRVAIEGFNVIYEYIKLRYGKLYPGMQVATFMPDQNGPCAYDRDWKFDIAAGYYYAAPSRTRYASIRRMKTLWPERPVLWLNQGKAKVGLGLNLTNIGHATSVPSTPLHSLTDITSADSICTWLAGGHTGLFSIYLFVHVGWRGEDFGVWVQLEDITDTSPVLEKAIEHSFRGLAEKYRVDHDIKNVKPGMTLDDADAELTLDDLEDAPDPHAERAAREKAEFRRGFLLERKLIQDAVNLLSGVEFPQQHHEILLIGPRSMRAPAFDLANAFDCFTQIDKLAGADLASYKFIGLTGQNDTVLRDATITALSQWLTSAPGLLYVHGWLPTENDNGASTVQNLTGHLTMDWPWEDALEPIAGTRTQRGRQIATTEAYRLKSGEVEVLHEVDGKPVLVFWRGDGMPSGVVFDAGKIASQDLKPILNRVAQAHKIGVTFDGPVGMLEAKTPEVHAVVSDGAATAPYSMRVVDALTGMHNPELPPGRAGVFGAHTLRGAFSVAANGVTVLCDAPVEAFARIENGLKLECRGLIQAVSAMPLQVEAETDALPPVDDATLMKWLFASDTPGIAVLEQPGSTGRVTLIRTTGAVRITTGDQ